MRQTKQIWPYSIPAFKDTFVNNSGNLQNSFFKIICLLCFVELCILAHTSLESPSFLSLSCASEIRKAGFNYSITPPCQPKTIRSLCTIRAALEYAMFPIQAQRPGKTISQCLQVLLHCLDILVLVRFSREQNQWDICVFITRYWFTQLQRLGSPQSAIYERESQESQWCSVKA